MKISKLLLAFISILLLSCDDSKDIEVQPQPEDEISYPNRYYIDPENGAYYNTGHSPSQAWESFDRFLDQAWQPGDTILIKRGTVYEGSITLKGSGEPGKPIVLGSYGSEDLPLPEIRCKGKANVAVMIRNVEYWEIHDFKITNKGDEPRPKSYGIKIEAENMPEGIMNHIHIKRCIIQDIYGTKTTYNGGGGAAIHYYNAIEGQIPSSFNDILIEDCYIRNCQRDGIAGFLSSGARSKRKANTNFVVRGNTIEEVPGDQIIINGCDDAIVENNIVRNCMPGDFSPEDAPNLEAAAGIWCMHSDGTIIRYNTVQDHKATWDGQAFDCDQNCQNSLFEYNISYNNVGGFILLCPSDANFNQGYAEWKDNVFRYNISINDGTRDYVKENGLTISSLIDVVGRIAGGHFYNNTFIKTKSAATNADNSAITFDYYQNIPNSLTFTNNIFYNTTTVANPFYKVNFGTLTENKGVVFQNNCIYGYSTPPPGSGEYNKNNITADPKFTRLVEDFVNNNNLIDKDQILEGLKLATGSPCIGTGVSILDDIYPVSNDFWGESVGSSRNMGAYNH